MVRRRQLYVDHLSQPSRALLIFCRCSGVAVDEVRVSLRKGDQRAAAYRAINPLLKVPCLLETDDSGETFNLPESCAILRYLCASGSVPGHWYPTEARARARVDAALDWHHSTLRRGASTLVFLRFFRGVNATGEEDPRVKEALAILREALAELNSYWLRDKAFLGGEQVCIADLVLGCEVSQLCLLNVQPDAAALVPPRVAVWLAAVEAATQPHWATVHSELRAAAARGGVAKL